jgi:thymidine kinase
MKPLASARWVEQVERRLVTHGIDLSRVYDQLAVPVLCGEMQTDFQGEPFEGSKHRLAWTDDLIEIKTNCRSGKQATMNARLDNVSAVAHRRPAT